MGIGLNDWARVQCRVAGRDRPVNVGGVGGPLPDVQRRAELRVWTGCDDRVPVTCYLVLFTEPIVRVRAEFEDNSAQTLQGADAGGLLVVGGFVPTGTGLVRVTGLNRANEVVGYGRR
jgi:hypothetical protein